METLRRTPRLHGPAGRRMRTRTRLPAAAAPAAKRGTTNDFARASRAPCCYTCSTSFGGGDGGTAMSGGATFLEAALGRSTESADVVFRAGLDTDSEGEWCEILRDVFALANSGGGVIVVGVDGAGRPLGVAPELETLDPSLVADKIYAYTQQNFGDIEIARGAREGRPVVAIRLGAAAVPLVPATAGSYASPEGVQRTAFVRGVVYVRHGAKSEPATSDDLGKFMEARIAKVRDDLLEGVTRVFEAPPAPSSVQIVTDSAPGESAAPAVRLSAAPEVEAVPVLDPNRTHPYRMKDLLEHVNAKLPDTVLPLNAYDIRVALAVFAEANDLSFVYRPDFGPTKYSPAFADWLLAELGRNRHKLRTARSMYRRLRREGSL